MICISGGGILCQIPADTEYAIYVSGGHTVSKENRNTGKTERVEYGDLVIDTPTMRRIFRGMKNPSSCVGELEDAINEKKDGYQEEAYISLFDGDWDFECFECQRF